MYNMQITEDSCVYITRMIAKGTEQLCTYVQDQMIPEQEQENFVEACSQHVQASYGEMRLKKVCHILTFFIGIFCIQKIATKWILSMIDS